MIDISKKYLFGVNVAKIYKHAEMRAEDTKNRHINQQLGEPNKEDKKGQKADPSGYKVLNDTSRNHVYIHVSCMYTCF